MADYEPIHYRLLLEPDLADFRFSASISMRLAPSRPIGEIVLNARELAVWEVRWVRENDSLPCPFQIDPEKETLSAFLPECVAQAVELHISYEGVINDKMAGLYRSSYRTEEGVRWIAVSQFQESDARRVLPCLDHPAAKATFDIEMTVDESMEAVSNGAVVGIEPLNDGRKRVRFETTPKMSTYLLFMGIGRFETVKDAQDHRVRALTVPGMSGYADFGLEFGRNALQYCENFFGTPYPLSKLDLIAVPDFAFGAMENWGAITFRENLLLRYPESTSKAGLERICEVTAHEIVHQWFGNLVTPEDWRYLWLNESFATFFAYKVVDHFQPDWRIWDRFIGGQTAEALERDGLKETFAIEIPGGEHVVINSSTAPIIYSKGASVLRQVLGFIGPDAFQKGLCRYLATYAYDTAESGHLWEALEAACGRPITRMMEGWIGQPGYPLIEVMREGRRLQLRQRRFSYLEATADTLWMVPVNIRLFGPGEAQRTHQVVMEDAAMEVEVDGDFDAFNVNDGQSGFYRVRYRGEDDLNRLGGLVRQKRLPAPDRWGLVGDLEALLRAGEIDLDRYLRFLGHYEEEDRLLPLAQIVHSLHRLYVAAPEGQKQRIASFAGPLLQGRLEAVGYSPAAEESHGRAILREHLLWPASLLGVEKALRFGRSRFEALANGRRVDPEIFKSVLQIGAWTCGEQAFSWFMDRLEVSQSEHERMTIATAMGCFRQRRQVEGVLEAVLTKLPDRNKFIPVVALAANPDAIEHLWPWYTENLSAIEAFHPLLYERVVAALIPASGMAREKEVKDFFSAYLQRRSLAGDAIRMSLERLEINLALRRRMEE